jgi:hypothetical protein
MSQATVVRLYQDQAAERIAAKIEAWRKNESEWAVVVMDLARELWTARQKHPSDQAFGVWFNGRFDNIVKPPTYKERAALLEIGEHADIAAPLLAKTERRSVRTFVDAELKPLIKPPEPDPEFEPRAETDDEPEPARHAAAGTAKSGKAKGKPQEKHPDDDGVKKMLISVFLMMLKEKAPRMSKAEVQEVFDAVAKKWKPARL